MASETSTDKLKAWLARQDPDQQQRLIKASLVTGLVVLGIALYYGSGQDEKAPPAPPPEVAVIDVGEGRLEDDMRAQLEKQGKEHANQNQAQDKKVASLEQRLEDQQAATAQLLAVMESMAATGAPGLPSPKISLKSPPQNPDDWEAGIRRPETSASMRPTSDPRHSGLSPSAPPPIEMIGGISMAKGLDSRPVREGDSKKGPGPSWYLPVSFMPAKLLTGLKAKTVDSARGDPEPILLRVQAPAVLPNEIRAELSGCLVVAHGYGSLASERVEARLVSLNCMNQAGELVIESEITGIVVDQDGVKGLAGHPVSKMGTNLARLAFAAAIEGAGEAFSDQATTTSISPLGATRNIDTGQIGRSAAGDGVARAAGEYSTIIAELVRQQAPVIEVGPSKDVTVVLTEGVFLEITASRKGASS